MTAQVLSLTGSLRLRLSLASRLRRSTSASQDSRPGGRELSRRRICPRRCMPREIAGRLVVGRDFAAGFQYGVDVRVESADSDYCFEPTNFEGPVREPTEYSLLPHRQRQSGRLWLLRRRLADGCGNAEYRRVRRAGPVDDQLQRRGPVHPHALGTHDRQVLGADRVHERVPGGRDRVVGNHDGGAFEGTRIPERDLRQVAYRRGRRALSDRQGLRLLVWHQWVLG